MNTELKPCPLPGCTGENEDIEYCQGRLTMRVMCGCGVSGPFEATMNDAAEGWNALPRGASANYECPFWCCEGNPCPGCKAVASERGEGK